MLLELVCPPAAAPQVILQILPPVLVKLARPLAVHAQSRIHLFLVQVAVGT